MSLLDEHIKWLSENYTSSSFVERTISQQAQALQGIDANGNSKMSVEEFKTLMQRLYPGNPISRVPCDDPRNKEVLNFIEQINIAEFDAIYEPALVEFRKAVRGTFPAGVDYTPQACDSTSQPGGTPDFIAQNNARPGQTRS